MQNQTNHIHYNITTDAWLTQKLNDRENGKETPRGYFLIMPTSPNNFKFIAIDNTSGDLWVEEFDSYRECIDYFENGLNTDSAGVNHDNVDRGITDAQIVTIQRQLIDQQRQLINLLLAERTVVNGFFEGDQ